MRSTPPRLRFSALILTSAALLAACGSDDRSASAPSAESETSASAATAPAVGAPSTTGQVALAAWQTTPMTDVDGESFTVADFIGRPVLVETFATWCTNCRAQLRDTQAAAAEMGEDAVVLALSVETELSAEDVARYAADNGFTDIRFAVMTPEALAASVDAFGNTLANPPSTPKVIVDATGAPGELSTGAESSDSLVQQLRDAAG